MSDLKDLKLKIRQFQQERDWEQYHNGKDVALSLVLEAAEVLELFQWEKTNELPKEKKEDLADELADVLYWVITLSDKYGIDLKQAALKKLEKTALKYPIEKSKGKSTKYTKLK